MVDSSLVFPDPVKLCHTPIQPTTGRLGPSSTWHLEYPNLLQQVEACQFYQILPLQVCSQSPSVNLAIKWAAGGNEKPPVEMCLEELAVLVRIWNHLKLKLMW